MTGSVPRAQADAASAARRAGVTVVELDRPQQHAELSRLLDEVWGSGDATVVHQNVITALHHSGNYVVGAMDGDRLVGGAVGFVALHADPYLHSHVTGVRPRAQAGGVGRALKLHQRWWSLERGLAKVMWTYDPLVRHNAYFNVMKLGVVIVGYEDDFYGRMSDGLNENEESDRCLVKWNLASQHVERVLSATLEEPDVDHLVTRGARVALDGPDDGPPVVGAVDGDVVLCRIPRDIVDLRKSQPEVAREWRVALRSTLGAAISMGYVVSGMTRFGWYVLGRAATLLSRSP